MAMTALEIEAIFRIQDFATPAFRKIAEEARTLKKVLTDIAADTSAAMGSSFNTMTAGVTRQIGEVDALAQAWVRVAGAARAAAAAAQPQASVASAVRTATAPAMPLPALPAVPGGGGPRIPGAHFSPSGIPVPGGHVNMLGNQALIAAAVVGGYGVEEAFKMGDVVSRGLANVFPEGSVQDREAKQKELEAVILREAAITKLPLETVSKMALDEVRTNANQSWEARMRIMPMVIENAAREAYIKGTSPEATTSALIGQLHQTGAFSQEEIEKNLPMLAYFASKDPNSITQIARSAAYHSPLSRTMMGIPIEQDLAAQVVLDRTGVGGKSGTWLREMAVRAVPPLATDMSKKAEARRAQLRELGLVDEAGKATWMTEGHFDESKLLHILSEKIGKMPLEERTARLGVFGERGKGAVAIMTDPAMLKQYDDVLSGARNLQSTTEFWKEQNQNNPMQQMKGAWVELQTVLLAIGQTALPSVVAGFKTLEAGLAALNTVLAPLNKLLGTDLLNPKKGSWNEAIQNVAKSVVTGGVGMGDALRGLLPGAAPVVPGGLQPSGGARAPSGMIGPVLPGLLFGAPAPATFDDRFGFPTSTVKPFPPAAVWTRGTNFIPPPASFNDRFGFGGTSPASPASLAPPGVTGSTAGEHQKAITVATNLNIDGRTLASIVSEHLVGAHDTSGGTYGPGNAQYSAS